MAKLSEINEEKLDFGLKKLKELIAKRDKEGIFKTLKELIPAYQPVSY